MIKFFYLILLMCTFFSGCSSHEKKMMNKKASIYFAQGTQALMEKRFTDALASLIKANELRPNDPDILNNLGMAYFFKEEKDKAISYLNNAIKENENHSDAKSNLATIYYKNKQYDIAKKLYLEVASDLTYKKLAVTYYNLGYLERYILKNSKLASKYFLKSIKEDENYCPSHFQLGLIYYEKKSFDEALKFFRESSMGVCHQSPEPIYYQAKTLIKMRQFDEAYLKLDLITTQFSNSPFAVKAKEKLMELSELNKNRSSGSALSKPFMNSSQL